VARGFDGTCLISTFLRIFQEPQVYVQGAYLTSISRLQRGKHANHHSSGKNAPNQRLHVRFLAQTD
jgi:hypothetical protein